MVERQRQRIEYEITKMVDEMDKEYLRKIQVLICYMYNLAYIYVLFIF